MHSCPGDFQKTYLLDGFDLSDGLDIISVFQILDIFFSSYQNKTKCETDIVFKVKWIFKKARKMRNGQIEEQVSKFKVLNKEVSRFCQVE